MNLPRELTLQGREKVEQLMRLVAAACIRLLAVNDLLQDEMTVRVMRQVGGLVRGLEVSNVAMQVANDEDVGRARNLNQPPLAPRGQPHGLASLVQGT